MNSNKFRNELKKLLPGYKWVVPPYKPIWPDDEIISILVGTGIISRGFNRMSTIEIERRETKKHGVEYTAKSAPNGTRSDFVGIQKGDTLRQAVRNLQGFYENRERLYGSLAAHIRDARVDLMDGEK